MSTTKQTSLIALALLVQAMSASATAVPHATCRTTDRPETGMSGETSQSERDSGAAAQGFKCNADLVGQYQGEGASWQLTAWKNCAYFDQRHPASADGLSANLAHPGVVVVDVSDPTKPVPTTWLNTPAMIDPWESLKVNPARQLLAGDQRPNGAVPPNPAAGFDVYDISADCKHPVLQSAKDMSGSIGHTGQWAPDGKTYYVTPLRPDLSIIALDVTDPVNPAPIAGGIKTFASTELPLARLHDSEFSKDGNTAYITMFGNGATSAGNGFAILDVSDFQQRRPNPTYRVKSSLTWDDGSVGAQNALAITIAGKPYVLVTDEGGNGVSSCTQGKSAFGFPRLIDVTDPSHPVVTAKIQLDVHDPANCSAIETAPVTASKNATTGVVTTAPGFFGFSCHYCNVDDADNAKIAACNCFAAGLRIFDIHDPANIKEMAYYKPPAQGGKALPGSNYQNASIPTFDKKYDYATSKVSFPKDRGMTTGDIWTTSQDNGFQVISLFSAVTVTTKNASIRVNGVANLSGTVTGAASTGGLVWAVQEANGGTVDSKGVYTAPKVPGTYHVTATALLDATKSDTATIVVDSARGCSTGTGASLGGLLIMVGAALLLRRRGRG